VNAALAMPPTGPVPVPVPGAPWYDVVVPTVGRASLRALLDELDAQRSARRGNVIVVDDRRDPVPGLAVQERHLSVLPVSSGGRGPAAARNAGVRASTARWVVFVDDDVMPTPSWTADLERDLAAAEAAGMVAATQGQIVVPLPRDRRPTDWERNVAGLETAQWATADMAYRRDVLDAVGGFDERFPRAYREDADLALRVAAVGLQLVRGTRVVHHPVRLAPWHVSIGKQAGNIDDALMGRVHGRDWRTRAGAPRGRRPFHLATTMAGAVTLGALLGRRTRVALAASAVWGALTADFARRRIVPGPRRRDELAAMVVTSIAIPPTASFAWACGVVRARRLHPRRGSAGVAGRRVDAVLFDRDGTLVVDVPYNADPRRVRPVPGARQAVQRVRDAGLRVAVISNQSGVARGLLHERDVRAVNARVDELVGPFDAFLVCPHGPDEGCSCRKPAPGLVHDAAAQLGVEPERCAVIGDIGADVEAARRAGALGVLVPTPVTRAEEVAAAPIGGRPLAAAGAGVLRHRDATP
jgi:histidinol-phosphate phosphatase family protein